MEILRQLELPSLVIVVLVSLFLAAIVFYRDHRSKSNILFVLLCFSFVTWALTNYYSLHPPFGGSLLWVRLVLFFAAPQAYFFALFTHIFPKKEMVLKKKYLIAFTTLLVIQMLITQTNFVFSGFDHIKGLPIAGMMMPLYAIILVSFFAIGIYWLFKRLIYSKDEERKPLVIVSLGFIITIAFVLSFLLYAVVVLKTKMFVPLSPVFILPFLIATSYAISREKFLNIKLVATEFLVGTLTVGLLTEAFLSGDWLSILIKSIFSFFIVFIGISLIKSVHREINQRERLAKLAESLEAANLRLQELDRQKTEFLSIASHQLRTPISIIKGYLELIHDGAYGKITKETDQILSNMDETNERLVKLIDEFLDISRIEQGRTEFVFEESDLNKLITSVVIELKERALEKHLEIKWKAGKTPLSICMDKEKIRHVVFNFVDNAIKYTEKGSIKIVVEKEGNGVSVKVDDTGLGFGKVDEANFFQKFYRGKNVEHKNVNGTGLGIYVCRQFIEKHKGRVWAKSAGLGKGSEFGFWIPRKNGCKKKAKKASK